MGVDRSNGWAEEPNERIIEEIFFPFPSLFKLKGSTHWDEVPTFASTVAIVLALAIDFASTKASCF